MRLKIDEEDLRCSSQNSLLSGNRSILKSLSKLVKYFKEITLIPHRLSSTTFLRSPKAFVRQCKLTLPSLIVLRLSLTASGKSQGVDGKVGAFFRQARRSG
jgi:hypothetical protein